jgi:Zn-dependent peptidase ImmA (M78 family)/transcriptional regulator with XRE-family HTH domain
MPGKSLPMRRLIVARKLQGLSRAALGRLVGCTGQAITQYESGARMPDLQMLSALSKNLQVPVSFLTADHDRELVERSDCNFRSLARTPAASRQRAEAQCDLLLMIAEFFDDHLDNWCPPPDVPCAVGDIALDTDEDAIDAFVRALNPEGVARALREEWELGLGPIDDVIGLLEEKGVFAHTIHDEASTTVDAFSLWTDRPVVMLNVAKGDVYRSRMDAGHELGHLVMHPPSVTKARTGTTPDQEIEQQAKIFAGAFLVPASAWIQEAPRSTNPYAYLEASARWKVSVLGLIVRSYRVGVLNERQYRSTMVRYSEFGWRKGEPRPEDATEEVPSTIPRAMEGLEEQGIDREFVSARLGFGVHFSDFFGHGSKPPKGVVIPFPAKSRTQRSS